MKEKKRNKDSREERTGRGKTDWRRGGKRKKKEGGKRGRRKGGRGGRREGKEERKREKVHNTHAAREK